MANVCADPNAPPPPPVPIETPRYPVELSVDMGVFSRSDARIVEVRLHEPEIRVGSETGTSFVFHGGLRYKQVEFGASASFVTNSWDAGDTQSSSSTIDNIAVGGFHHWTLRWARIRAGAEIVAPAGGSDVEGTLALGRAGGSRGMVNWWMFAPRNVGLPMSARFIFGPDEGVRFGTELAVSPQFYMGQGPKETSGVVQLSADVRYKRDVFYTGARLATVFAVTRAATETFVSIYPNVGLDFGHVFLDGGLLVNLNEPLGPFFGSGTLWSFRLNGGARF